MFYDMFPRVRMNAELAEKEAHTFPSRAEKRCLRQAEQAERAFRAARGYEPDTFWARLKRRLAPPKNS